MKYNQILFLPHPPWNQQNDMNTGLDMSEARASLLSGDVVELTNVTTIDSTSMKLLWEVSSLHLRILIE